MYKHLLSLLTVAAVAASIVAGCSSPLDADGPRIRTTIEPRPKVEPVSIDIQFVTETGEYAFDSTPVILVDTGAHPMRIWMDFSMAESTNDTNALIKAFKVRVDSMACYGDIAYMDSTSVQIRMDVREGAGLEWFGCGDRTNIATVDGVVPIRDEGDPKEIIVTIFISANTDRFFSNIGTEQILGTVRIVL